MDFSKFRSHCPPKTNHLFPHRQAGLSHPKFSVFSAAFFHVGQRLRGNFFFPSPLYKV